MHQKESPIGIGKNSSRTWNSDLPLRLNQDMQRESDVKRMRVLIEGLRLEKSSNDGEQKKEVSESGLFSRIENNYKSMYGTQYTVAASNYNRKTKI